MIVEKLDFGQALKEAKEKGKLISRESWDSKDVFVYYRGWSQSWFQVGDKNDAHDPDIPQRVVDKLRDETIQKILVIETTQHLCLKNAISGENSDYTITIGWVPSQEDILAKDWYILD